MKKHFSGETPSLFAADKKGKNTRNTKKYTKNTRNTQNTTPIFRTLAAGTYQPALTLARPASLDTWTESLAASKQF